MKLRPLQQHYGGGEGDGGSCVQPLAACPSGPSPLAFSPVKSLIFFRMVTSPLDACCACAAAAGATESARRRRRDGWLLQGTSVPESARCSWCRGPESHY